jgi:N-acetylglutamate synthase-like GNAT family acetyltransferase
MGEGIRRATLGDVPAIVEIAVESVTREPWPLRVSREKMANAAEALIRDNASFIYVGESAGKVEACVAAETGPGFWFERLQSSVLLFYTRKPGLGAALLREYARWVKSRPAIKVAVFALEPSADPRVATFLRRLGFSVSGQQMSYIRGL